VATYQCVYTATLIVPVAAFFVSVDQKHNRPLIFFATSQRRRVLNTCAHAIGVFVAAIAVLLFASRQLTGSWHFLYSTYGFHLTYPDMTPNVGMFWYFFIEIFDHFRVFFLWVFQMNAFFYVVPFAMLFREHPVAMFHSLLAMAAIFKPYPTYADAGLWMSLLPMWYFVYPFMRTILPSIGVLVSTFVLSPILAFVDYGRQRQFQLLLRHHFGLQFRADVSTDRSRLRPEQTNVLSEKWISKRG